MRKDEDMRKKVWIGGVVAATLIGAAAPACAQNLLDEGYWVIVGAYPQDQVLTPGIADGYRNRAAPCGLPLFGDYSAKFEGFRAGLMVMVLESAYATRDEADAALAEVRPCVPDAYVKYGRYAGE